MNARPMLAAIALLGALDVFAIPSEGASQTKCDAAQRHQFDFWLGSWRVVDATGKLQGTNKVTSEYGGCALQEHWRGTDGSQGSSFNTYVPDRNEWHQTWVDNNGLTLLLFGTFNGKSMVLSGSRIDAHTGRQIVDRITWTPLKDGRVRQHWQESDTARMRWTEIFDGYYVRSR